MDSQFYLRKADRTKNSDPDFPEYPTLAVMGHGVKMGSGIGSLFGLMVVTPLYKIVKKVPMKQAWLTISPIMFAGGVMLGAELFLYKFKQGELTDESLDDRALRIVKNEKITKLGQYMSIGSLGCIAAGVVLIPSAGPAGLVASYATGTSLGILAFLSQNVNIDQVKNTVTIDNIRNNPFYKF